MHIELIGKKQHYSLDFEGKFNVITGLSGSKKTAFVKLLNKYKQGVHSITLNATVNFMCLGKDQIEVFSNERSIVGDIEAYFQSFDHHLVIIDESSELYRRKDIGHILKKSNNFFVLISRAVGWLPISVDSVYQLVDENHVITNRALYCTKNNELTTIINPIEYILTEDGMSSRLFFLNWFKNIKVCDKTFCYKGKNTQRDNSLLHVALEEELLRYNYLLVVFDASAYGYYYPLLCDVIRNSKKKVSLISWDSFENYILQCPAYHTIITKADVSCMFNSIEQLSTERLKQLSSYDKGKLPKCLLTDRSFIQPPLTQIKAME